MTKTTKRADDGGGRESGINAVDEHLPECINRRRFLETSVTGTLLAIAGCAGDGSGSNDSGGGDTTTNDDSGSDNSSGDGSDLIGSEMPFRLPVEPGPNYATSYAAKYQGFWEDAGIVAPTPEGGNGSGDTSKRVGTGVNKIGHAAATPQVAGLARQGFDILQFGTAKARSQAGLIHRKDAIPDPYDPESIKGANIAAADGLDEQMWQLFLSGIGADNIEIEYIDTSAAASLLEKGDIDAIWDSINDYAELDSELDIELGFGSLYQIVPLGGYYIMVNGSWYEDQDQGQEYITRLMEGYSAAGHWALTNREAAMEMLTEQVPELQTLGTEQLLRAFAAGVAATNLTEGVKENGFGYIDPEVQQNTFDTISNILDVETPSADEIRLTEVTENVELTTFSDDEWADLEEFASPYSEFFEKE